MDPVAGEPVDSSGIPYMCAPAEPTGRMDAPSCPQTALIQHTGTDRVPTAVWEEDPVPCVRVVDVPRTPGNLRRLFDLLGEVKQSREFLDGLDEDQSADVLSALRFATNGDTIRLGHHDLVVYGPNNFSVIECKLSNYLPAIRDESRPHRRPAALIADEPAGALWRGLPVYAQRSFTLQACCAVSVPTSVSNVIGPSIPEATASLEDEWACILLIICEMHPPRASIRTTTQDRRLVRDYREGLRRFLGSVLVLLSFMIVTLLVALSHQAQTPTFLFVMLATARRYGRRGDGDVPLVPAPVLQPICRQGAVCLAA